MLPRPGPLLCPQGTLTLGRAWIKTESALAAAVYARVARRASRRGSAASSALSATANAHAYSASRALARGRACICYGTLEDAEAPTLHGFAAKAGVIAMTDKADGGCASQSAMALSAGQVVALLPATSAPRPANGLGLSREQRRHHRSHKGSTRQPERPSSGNAAVVQGLCQVVKELLAHCTLSAWFRYAHYMLRRFSVWRNVLTRILRAYA